jgi:hypothetical protein
MSRPVFRPTSEQRTKVMRYVYAGMVRADIAVAIGVDQKTLNKHFERELLHGHEIMRQRLYAMVLESALEGKKAAMRLLAQMNDEDASSRRRRAASYLRPRA